MTHAESETIRKYKAFLSYSHADELFAAKLHRRLERYRIPNRLLESLSPQNRKLKPIFRDRDELSTSESLSAALTSALLASDYLIVVCSPASANSKWVNEEVKCFKRWGRADRIICIIAAGESDQQVFVPALLHDVDSSGEIVEASSCEPLAADARGTGDGLARARLKVIAGLLAVPLDDLVRRHHQQRTRSLTAIAIGASAGMAITLAVAIYAILQRNSAETQKQIALREAATSQEVTQFMVGLFKVSDPRSENPRELTALTLLDRGAEDIRSRLNDQPGIKGALMSAMGEVYINLGLFPQAEKLLSDAVELSDLVDLRGAEARLILASAELRQSNYDAAEELLTQVEAWLAINAPQAAATHQRLNHRWGNLLFFTGRNSAAVDRYAAALAFANPGKPDSQYVATLINLANAHLAGSDYQAAERVLLRAIAILEELPGKTRLKLGAAHQNLANVYIEVHRFDEARRHLEQALAIYAQLLAPDHTNIALSHYSLASLYRRQEQLPQAYSEYTKALEIGKKIFGENHGFIAAATEERGVALAGMGQLKQGLEQIRRAREMWISIVGRNSGDASNNLRFEAEAYRLAGNAKLADKVCDEAYAILETNSEIDHSFRVNNDWKRVCSTLNRE